MIVYNNIESGITEVYLGNTNIAQVYIGSNKVFPSDVPPTPTRAKFSATYIGGQTYSAECDGNAELTSATTRPSGYEYTAMTKAIVGDCITSMTASFRDCISLTSVGSIGSGASVEIPSSVTELNGGYGRGAFQNCSGLTNVDLPNTVTYIGEDIFLNCHNLSSVRLSDNISSIPIGGFDRCVSIQTLDISNTKVTSIGQYAFVGCTGLTSIITPTTLESVSDDAFSGCTNLLSFNAPNVNNLSLTSFARCTSLSSVTVTANYCTFGDYVFSNCTNLKRLNSNVDGVINIPNTNGLRTGMFFNCKSISTVNIPSGVTSIRQSALEGCSGLTSIVVNAVAPPTLGTNAFKGSTCTIYVPSGSVDAYKAASGWSDYADRIQPIP